MSIDVNLSFHSASHNYFRITSLRGTISKEKKQQNAMLPPGGTALRTWKKCRAPKIAVGCGERHSGQGRRHSSVGFVVSGESGRSVRPSGCVAEPNLDGSWVSAPREVWLGERVRISGDPPLAVLTLDQRRGPRNNVHSFWPRGGGARTEAVDSSRGALLPVPLLR